ncbi:MAG: hypothetical protein WB609_06945 [Candidatus Cybelea sp.]
MRRILALFAFAVGFAVPAAAQPSTGMAAMQYYVGTWSCMAGNVGQPPVKATATFYHRFRPYASVGRRAGAGQDDEALRAQHFYVI